MNRRHATTALTARAIPQPLPGVAVRDRAGGPLEEAGDGGGAPLLQRFEKR